MGSRSKDTKLKDKIALLRKVKSAPCAICNNSYHYAAMDLHHRNPEEKVTKLSKGVTGLGYDRFVEEIKKCIVLCSNCHRMLHAGAVVIPECHERDSNP